MTDEPGTLRVTLRIHGPKDFDARAPWPVSLELPSGCVGVMMVWDDEGKAREWYGDNMPDMMVGGRESDG